MPNKKVFLRWTLVLIWMCVIFYFSSRPIVESHAQSYFVLEAINKVLKILGIHSRIVNDALNFILRKTAHVSEYAILGVLMYMAFLTSNIRIKKAIFIYSLLGCILYAATDEIHQLYVQGRSACLADVIIDSSGSYCGLIITSIFNRRKTDFVLRRNNQVN